MEPFRVRLNCIDHYQATPSKLDPPLPFRDGNLDDNAWPKVPVIRVFGATETGQRVCVHVHGAFPYLYIEYSGSVVPEAVSSAIRTLHISIDHALAASFRCNAYDRKTAYVAHITLVKGIPFYGYHVGYRTFFKIYLLNPFYVTRLTDLLHEGAVLNRPLQRYESHLQYVPQWMCDYNLYGCGYMDCGKVTFRRPVPEYLELNHPDHRWHDRSISIDSILEDPTLEKQSYCPLEADVCVHDILNRRNITERALHHDFTEFLRPAAFNERLVPSLAGLWQDETRRRKKRLGITDPGSTPFSPDELVSMSAEPRMQSKGGWVHEDEFHELALQIAVDEKNNRDGEAVSFETFVDGQDMQNIKTALSSVEDFYPDRFDSSVRHDDHPLQHAPDEEPPHVSADERLAPTSPTNEERAVEEEPQQPQSPANRVIEESFYDGVFDEYPPAGEAEDPRPVNATFVPGFNEVSRKAPSFLSTGLQPSNERLDDERENAQNLAKRSHPEILDSDQSRPAKQPRIPVCH
ncbi:uncharacterized protein N7473_011098 [Penicillium subrubescens]|uniref:uncharacterized protein n=1 Tax=Penicillium subrubescens TaxID=1316194 RepID=UPI00254512E4|nr:uncharacterized protein N7473_011098 [Penicillium subrubescens]KAJ5882836.1 hypothetical protein N7473_011098 [Penicillium subrubescens]